MTLTELIKTLREQTGAGMLDCKKALEQSNNDLDKAADWLREKGISKAAKKADRIAAEGLANTLVNGDRALIVEINSETDFAAKNDLFKELVNKVSTALLASNAKTLEEGLAYVHNGESVNDMIVNATAVIGEKISLRRFEVVTKNSNDVFGSYKHMGGKICSLVVLGNTNNEEVAKDIAMQIAAANPTYKCKEDIPASEVEKETAIQTEIVKNDPKLAGKPEAALKGIIAGKVNKTFKEVCLNDQEFVKDPSLTVEKYLANNKTSVVRFVRYGVGEGMAKREENFAEEVAKQMK